MHIFLFVAVAMVGMNSLGGQSGGGVGRVFCALRVWYGGGMWWVWLCLWLVGKVVWWVGGWCCGRGGGGGDLCTIMCSNLLKLHLVLLLLLLFN